MHITKKAVLYCFEPEDFQKLRNINSRLFNETPYKLDEMRDLANLMFVILERAEIDGGNTP